MKTEVETFVRDQITMRASALITRQSVIEVSDDGTLAEGADLQKVIKATIKKADDQRKEYVGPLNAVVKKINAEFKAMVAPLQDSAETLAKKMTTYVKEKDRLERERQKKLAKEAEERALKEAEELEKAGRAGEAEIAMEQGAMASDLVKERKPAPVRGDYGAVVSARRTWAFELVDLGEVPRHYIQLDERAVRNHIQSYVEQYKHEAKREGLTGKAVDVYVENKMEGFTIPGIRVYQEVGAVVR